MKFFIATCLREDLETTGKLFKEAGINTFSVSEITGHKDRQTADLLQDWFATGEEQFDSLLLFSFTADEQANSAMELIKQHNKITGTRFPVRAFIVPVEQSSY